MLEAEAIYNGEKHSLESGYTLKPGEYYHIHIESGFSFGDPIEWRYYQLSVHNSSIDQKWSGIITRTLYHSSEDILNNWIFNTPIRGSDIHITEKELMNLINRELKLNKILD